MFLSETESHQQAHHLLHPQMLHPLHGLGLLGFHRRLLRIKITRVVLGPPFRMGWTGERRLHSDSGRKGKQGTSTRILHPPKGGRPSPHMPHPALALCSLYNMTKHTSNVPNTTFCSMDWNETCWMSSRRCVQYWVLEAGRISCDGSKATVEVDAIEVLGDCP